MKKAWIEVGKKTYDRHEINAVIRAVRTGQWSAGKEVAKFERLFARTLNRRFCITTNSGSSANLLAVTALTSPLLQNKRLYPGDEIITVAAAFPTTVNPILQNQLVPVFVDIDLQTLNINSKLLTKAVSPKTRAVVIAHTLGNPFDLATIVKFCRQHKLFLIEDNCDSLGSLYKGKMTGSFGNLATHSFYPAHHITMGEGGAVVTNDPLLAKILFALRDWGRYLNEPQPHTGNLPPDYDQRYVFYEMGYNFKITEMQAAIGLAQLTKLPQFTKKRILNATYLYDQLQNTPYLMFHPATHGSHPSWFGFPITIHSQAPFTRQEFVSWLHRHKIDTRLLLAGNLTKQPYFSTHRFPYRIITPLTNTDIVMRQTIWIGCAPSIGQAALMHIVKTIKEFITLYDH